MRQIWVFRPGRPDSHPKGVALTATTPKAITKLNNMIPKRDTEGMHAMKIKTLTLAVVAGLALAASAQAQYITGGQYLNNLSTIAGGYGGWSSANIYQTATGVEVDNAVGASYGGNYNVISTNPNFTQTLNANDTAIQLTITLNGPSPQNFQWFSPGQLVLNDANSPNSGPWY